MGSLLFIVSGLLILSACMRIADKSAENSLVLLAQKNFKFNRICKKTGDVGFSNAQVLPVEEWTCNDGIIYWRRALNAKINT